MNSISRFTSRITLYQWILVGILVLAAFIRLYQSTQYIPFWEEQVDDMLSIRQTWQNISTGNIKNLALKGQSGTYRTSYLQPKELTPVYHGVAYYYLLLPAAVIAQFNPYGVVLFLICLGLISVYLLYDAGYLLFRDRVIGLIAAFLGATSFWLSAYSRWIWTPSMVPFFSLLSLVSFLRVLEGKKTWWFPLVISLALGSQVHDSGYVPFVFFYSALLVYRPKLPIGLWSRVWLLILGLGPIVPTFINEISEGFRMTRSLSVVAYNAVPTMTTIAESLLRFIKIAMGMTIMSQKYIDASVTLLMKYVWVLFIAMLVVWIITVVFRKILPAQKIYRRKNSSLQISYKALIISWWIMCFPVSVLVEYLYADQVLNDYSRMNNLVFALPMVFLCVACICVVLWRRYHMIGRVVVSIGLVIFLGFNMVIIRDYLWRYTERDWAYQDLKTVSWLVPHLAGEEPYDLVAYRYQEGSYESKNVYVMLYFIELYPARMPERFNGGLQWGVTKEVLRGQSARQHFIVMDKRYKGIRDLPQGANLVGQTEGYEVYLWVD